MSFWMACNVKNIRKEIIAAKKEATIIMDCNGSFIKPYCSNSFPPWQYPHMNIAKKHMDRIPHTILYLQVLSIVYIEKGLLQIRIPQESGETGNLYVVVAMTKIKRTSVMESEVPDSTESDQPLSVI